MRYTTLLFIILSGCATPEQRADALITRYGPFCERMGFKQQSADWAKCIMQKDAEWQNSSSVCTVVGRSMICS